METKGSAHDVIVMGAGPAGSCAATLLAKAGRRVLVLEKERFPRYHVGESLIPETYWPLERMGVLDKIRAAGFTKKFSVEFASADGKPSKPFYFFETNHHESAVTWQVTRAEFDQILLDHAREAGAEAREGTAVKDLLFEGDQVVGVVAETTDEDGASGGRKELRAKVVVDATGMASFMASRLGLRVRDPNLKKATIYSYFKNAKRDMGVDEGATLVLKTPEGNGWFWFLPLKDGVTSVGVVADPDYLFKGRGKDRAKILDEEIEKCIAVRGRMEMAERAGDVYTISDFSYRTKRSAGPGYVLIGDAFGFLDPVYSSGVFLALKSGELAADSIEKALTDGDLSGEALGGFTKQLGEGLESFRRLVYAFYTPGFRFGRFMREFPQYRENLIDLLVGNVFRPGVNDIFDDMRKFVDIPAPLTLDDDDAVEPAPNVTFDKEPAQG